MLFRFDFKQDDEGRFLVDAHAGDAHGQGSSKPGSVAVLFADGATFMEVARACELDAGTVASLDEAAQTAMSQPGTTVCCMRLDLSEEQLVKLNLEPVISLYK